MWLRSPQGALLQPFPTLSNLGVALYKLGERETETTRIEEAVGSFRAAQEVCTRKSFPFCWAKIQYGVQTLVVEIHEYGIDAPDNPVYGAVVHIEETKRLLVAGFTFSGRGLQLLATIFRAGINPEPIEVIINDKAEKSAS